VTDVVDTAVDCIHNKRVESPLSIRLFFDASDESQQRVKGGRQTQLVTKCSGVFALSIVFDRIRALIWASQLTATRSLESPSGAPSIVESAQNRGDNPRGN